MFGVCLFIYVFSFYHFQSTYSPSFFYFFQISTHHHLLPPLTKELLSLLCSMCYDDKWTTALLSSLIFLMPSALHSPRLMVSLLLFFFSSFPISLRFSFLIYPSAISIISYLIGSLFLFYLLACSSYHSIRNFSCYYPFSAFCCSGSFFIGSSLSWFWLVIRFGY